MITDEDLDADAILREARRDLGLEQPAGWGPVDLSTILSGAFVRTLPELGCRSDGVPLLYRGKVHSLAGESEAGKSWLSLLFVREQLQAGADVVFIDFEDDAMSIVGRLHDLGLPTALIAERLRYVRPETPQGAGTPTALLKELDDCSLVVLDGVTEYMSLHGLNPKDDVDVAEMLELPRQLAAQGPAVLLLDHVVKDRQSRGRWATGSQHKLSGITGAAYILETGTPFALGQPGHSNLLVAKDRPGAVRASAIKNGKDRFVIGQLVMTDEDGKSKFALHPYESGQATVWKPTQKMQQISNVLAASFPEKLTYNQLKDSVGGNAGYVRSGTDALIEGGYVTVEDGPGRRILHSLVRPYAAPDEQQQS